MKIDILRENISEQSRFLKNNIELFFDKLDKIGEGGNATVSAWEGKNSANVCLKKIKELPVLKGNDLEREFDVQSQLFDADIKVPEPFLIFNDEKGNLYYFMERIRGASILEIGQGTKELPANFEIESFFQELENEVKKMHKAGFIHRDLRAGNVMILENGKPCLIDFGTAAKIANVEDIGMSAFDVLFYQFLMGIGLSPSKSKTLSSLNIPKKYFADF